MWFRTPNTRRAAQRLLPHARLVALALAVCAMSLRVAAAQTSETPTPFDSAGRVRSVTPSLASRLELAAPAWPVTGDYVEARLFAITGGGYVISVARKDERIDRFPLTTSQRDTLAFTIASAMERLGHVVAEAGMTTISEPAGTAFIVKEMALTEGLYAPALAHFAPDGAPSVATNLMMNGASFFILADLSKGRTITAAQTHAAFDGALRATILGFLTEDAFGSSCNADCNAATRLGFGLAGTVAGYQFGGGWTDGEAEAASSGSTFLSVAAIGASYTLGSDSWSHATSAIAVTGAVVGYGLGLEYPRQASYTVTAGDVDVIRVGSIIGAAAAAIPIAGASHPDSHIVAGLLTGGFVVGTIVGDRLLVRPYDFTEGEAHLVELGAFAGALMGVAIPVLTQSNNGTLGLSLATGGAILGTMGAVNLIAPRPASSLGGPQPAAKSGRASLELMPTGLALALAKRPGSYSLLRVTF